MDGLEFISVAPQLAAHPARADIALFVGSVALRGRSSGSSAQWLDRVGPVATDGNGTGTAATLLKVGKVLSSWFDEALARWLVDRGWLDPAAGRSVLDLLELRDIPVPIQSWDAFDALFAWDQRPVDASGRRADTLLGAAVRSFFAQGGRLCYVVRIADPIPVLASASSRRDLADGLLPRKSLSPGDRSAWRGVSHLFGLPEVSLLCVPDLPDLFAAESPAPRYDEREPLEEKFIECSERREPATFGGLRAISPPRCDAAGFQAWSDAVRGIAQFLSRHARETQFVAALPLPVEAGPSRADRTRSAAALRAQGEVADAMGTVFVQLAYPWLRTRDTAAVPGELEPPDGTLAGMIANQALTAGAWRTVVRVGVQGLRAVEPVLTRADLTMRDRVSVFGPTPRGFELLSDVTTAEEDAWRPASVNRLMNIIVRTARQAGEEFAFASSGERLWSQLREALNNRLAQLWAEGALDGSTREEAFIVRCDRSTMTQADLDAGRVIVRVEFRAARPIELIRVVLAMGEGGQISLVSRSTAGTPANVMEVA